MNIKEYLKEVHSNFVKSELTDILMGKTDVSCKYRVFYDEAFLVKTITVFELYSLIDDFQ